MADGADGMTPPAPRRPRLLLPLVALVAVALVVAGVVVALVRESGEPAGSLPGADDATEPTAPAPSGSALAHRDERRRQPRARPNLVMVLADDMRTDDLRWMPHVRSLIEDEGLPFRNSFSPNPLCAPARAALLSGQYSQNNGVYSVRSDNGFGAFDDSATLGTSLQAAGYDTLFLGKYLNGYGEQPSKVTHEASFRYVPPGWTDWRGSVERPPDSGYASGGTYQYYHLLLNVDGTIDDRYRGQYQTDVEGRIASRLVRRRHHSHRPFFLYWAPIAPHFGLPRESDDPLGVVWPDTGRPERFKTPARPPRFRGRFDGRILRASGLPADGGPRERDIRDKASPMRWLPELSAQERLADRTLTRQRAEALYALDLQVERLVHTLKATGEYHRTVIAFTSDNGYFLGEHRMRQGKIKAHEPSLRVPLVICGPGIPHGTRFDPATTEDLSATIVDLGHAKPPHPADGVSLVRSFRRDRGWRVPVLTEGFETSRVFRAAAADPAPGFDDARTTIGIRTPRWAYLRYDDGDGELYDLDHDPNELHSRFGDPRYARVQARLQRLWLAYRNCAGAACRRPMPVGFQRSPAAERVWTDRQSRGVERRYGYSR